MNTLFVRSARFDWEKIGRGSYLRDIPALYGVPEIGFHKPVTFFVGENGSGKSTALEAIAVAYGFNPEGGTKNYSFSTHDTHSELCGATTISRGISRPSWGYFLRAESFYNVATKEEEYSRGGPGAYVPREYHRKSHGESFLAMAQDNFRANGLYLLDEPEAALSPQRQMTLLLEIYNSVRNGSQFIIVSHSPVLLALPDAEILSFDDGPVHPVSYEETDSYRVMSLFINDREHMIKMLLETDDSD
jgi:predicted ATPase